MPISISVKSALRSSGQQSLLPRSRAIRSPLAMRQLAERAGGVAFDDRLHVVKWPVGLAIDVAAQRLIEIMGGRVPAPDGDVEPAGKRHAVVDHDQLLVLRGAEWHGVVEAEIHARRCIPLQR